ncbi:MAG: hypothetical protein Kow0080_11330 [Candidatus Promineifilaceae bacterium]
MTGTAAAIILGFLLATAYGAGFHLIMGGPARRLLLFLGASWVGFSLGHFLGDLLGLRLLALGVLNLFSASLGAWIGLFASWWYVSHEA